MFNSQNDKEFMESLGKLNDKNEPMMEDLMGLIVQTALSKDVMYPAVKEVTANFETYLINNKPQLEPQLYQQYVNQQKVGFSQMTFLKGKMREAKVKSWALCDIVSFIIAFIINNMVL